MLRHINISTFLCYKVGFPIRTSTDQSLFAAPRSLSQRSTSFIACVRLGIHQMPFWHLITLIINVINNKISVLFKSYDHLGDVIITLLIPVLLTTHFIFLHEFKELATICICS